MKLKSIFASGLTMSLLALPLIATPAMAAAPANDNISGATLISASSTSGSNVDSTDEANEYKSGDAQFNSSVWYYWVPTTSGSATISSCNSTAVTHLNVYTETEVGYPSSLAVKTSAPAVPSTACTNGDTVTFSAVATKRFYIQVLTTNGGEGAFTIAISDSTPPAVQKLDKVTICHRTHATTNPYRLITVSTSSIVGADSAINGHSLHNSKGVRIDGIFNPPYPIPSQKNWGDIIPPFTSTDSRTFAGLNWKWGAVRYGDAIFDKAEFIAIDATSGSGAAFEKSALQACQGKAAEMTDKELFYLERKNGETRDDILAEFQETDPAAKTQLLTELPPREGPKNIPEPRTDQSLSGVVWLDLNENGYQEDNEPNMPDIVVTVAPNFALSSASGISPQLAGPSTGRGAATAIRWKLAGSTIASELSGGISTSFRTVFTSVTTDANGAYSFPSLAAGDWTVVGVVPAGLGVTFDSQGNADALVVATVPVSGAAFTWVGLVYNPGYTPPTGTTGGSSVTPETSKAATSLADTGIADDGVLLGLLGLALTLLGISSYGLFRTRKNV